MQPRASDIRLTRFERWKGSNFWPHRRAVTQQVFDDSGRDK